MTEPLLFEIGTVIMVATALAYLARLVRQPMILGYIVAGFVIGPALAGVITNTGTIKLLSELGVAFLLFVVGLEIDFNKLKTAGSRTLFVALGQVGVTAAAAYAVAGFLGYSVVSAFYVAVALTFSSTVILIKLLSDKGTLDSSQGRLILAILLLQDAVAIFMLAILPTLGHTSLVDVGLSLGKGVVMFAVAIIASRTVIPLVMGFSARSTELLFLSAVSWLFLSSFLAEQLGYSVAIGAFLAGVSLASSSYKFEVASRVKSLRDFFATIFFVSLGMQLVLPGFNAMFVTVMVLTAVAILGKPLVVAMLGRFVGFHDRTSVMAALPMGHVGEFSIIIIALGLSLGHVTNELSSAVIAVAAISITVTTYVVKYDSRIYGAIRRLLKLRTKMAKESLGKAKYDVVLCGYKRTGYSIARKLEHLGKSYVIVDFDPVVVRRLKQKKLNVVYGDVGDAEFLKTLNLSKAELVISTVPDVADSQLIIDEAKKGKARVIVTANQIESALALYDYGASYVIIPHFIGGEHVALLLEKIDDVPSLMQHKFTHIRDLHKHKSSVHERFFNW